MGRDDRDAAAGFRDPIEFGNQREDIRHVLDQMTANDLVKLVVRKWIRDDAQIVNDVRVRLRIRIDSDRSRHLVPAAANVKNLSAG